MSAHTYQARRATLEDMAQMSALWQFMELPVDDLAKRITEFQVAEDPGNHQIVGALGMQIVARQGRLHSETFIDFGLSEHLRPLLWDRMHAVATNHGLLRLWTQEDAPFWRHCGLIKADAEALAKLPAPWRDLPNEWLTLKLKEDVESLISLDKEFAVFMESEKQRTARTFQQAKALKFVATVVAIILFGLVLLGAVYLVRHNPSLLRR